MLSPENRRRLYWVCLAGIALLYVLSVPWYRQPDEPLTLWLGMPDWVAVAVLCYVAVACLNAIAWILTDVPDEIEGLESEDPLTAGMPGREPRTETSEPGP